MAKAGALSALHVYYILKSRVVVSLRDAPTTRHVTKPCFDDDSKVITSIQSSEHRNIINIRRKHHEIYIRTMSLPYTISLAKPRHLAVTPEGLDTRMASYLNHPRPWALVLLSLHPLRWDKGFVLQVIDLAATHRSSSTDHTYNQGTTLHIETCVRGRLRVYLRKRYLEASVAK